MPATTPATPATLLAAAVLVALVAWWAALLVDDRRRRRRLEPLTAWLSAARVEAARAGTRLLLVVVEGEQAWLIEPRSDSAASPAAAQARAAGGERPEARPTRRTDPDVGDGRVKRPGLVTAVLQGRRR